LCRLDWHEGQDEEAQFYHGTVKPYPEGRHFAYIQHDEDPLRPEISQNGAIMIQFNVALSGA
jgi:hypothetical protein